jgi:hypothetical protein
VADEFDHHIARLNADQGRIYGDWLNADPLFAYLRFGSGAGKFGCLTQIKASPCHYGALAEGTGNKDLIDLVKRVASDERIPDRAEHVTLEMLPAFAEYQREYQRINKSLMTAQGA